MSPGEIDLEHFRAQLQRERTALLKLHMDSAGNRAVVMLDQTTDGRLSQVDAMPGQAMAQAAARQRPLREGAIDEALRRIDSGEFCDCDTCGEAMAPRRLEIDPTYRHCVRCAD